VSFEVGSNLDMNNVLTQNRVSQAMPQMPQSVKNYGVAVKKALAFPLLVLFLLSNKVYSPQYGLWLLPLFALGGSDLKTFVAFEVADVAVFLTRFSFFGDLSGFGGLPFGAFEVAILVRTLVLVWAVIAWVRRPTHDLPDLEAVLLDAPVDAGARA